MKQCCGKCRCGLCCRGAGSGQGCRRDCDRRFGGCGGSSDVLRDDDGVAGFTDTLLQP